LEREIDECRERIQEAIESVWGHEEEMQ